MNMVVRRSTFGWLKFPLMILPLLLAYADSIAQGVYGFPERLSDRAQMSILVASPSNDDVYTLYGHAGFRVQDVEQGLDVTINYGIFDFSGDFLFRFLKGQTDYLVMPQATDRYMSEYLNRGSSVSELVLNMPPRAIDIAWKSLLRDIDPEHCMYRYNFFYDNCSTRPFVIYEQAIESMGYEPSQEGIDTIDSTDHRYQLHLDTIGGDTKTSWRTEINALEAQYPWLVLGTDLLLGSQTDLSLTTRDLAFLPHNLERLLGAAYYSEEPNHADLKSGYRAPVRHPALVGINRYAPTNQSLSRESPWGNSLGHPVMIFAILLLLVLCSLWRSYHHSKYCMPFHYTVLILAGLVGMLIFYIAVLSEHPHRWPNYSLVVLHPLHLLLGLPLMLFRGRWGRLAYVYHFTNFVVQCAFVLLGLVCSIYFNSALYLIALSLGGLSLCYIIVSRRTIRSKSRGVDR